MVRLISRTPLHIKYLILTVSGEVVRLHGLGNEIVILNTLKSMDDLLVKQGHLYAHRPVFTLATELMDSSRVRQ